MALWIAGLHPQQELSLIQVALKLHFALADATAGWEIGYRSKEPFLGKSEESSAMDWRLELAEEGSVVDWLEAKDPADWLEEEGSADWLEEEGPADWLEEEGPADWLEEEGPADWLEEEGPVATPKS
ncbi:hypothetical protein FN846DRAFT_908417 [Sphaerosporella brunnea]|uniref:Uncharacterized protein n=1 Tax=Sphaerosporella brunnea TaxID=1250544 RepID=A0A5J5ETG0_9PEZI|nr:hypothetical protein FN846DRAFT_908417 [Sphaerosporella brunnea]